MIGPRAAEVDRSEAYPWENVEALKDAGFFGMTIPRDYGGQGASFLDAALAIEEMARVCGVTGRITVEANMGAISAVMHYGSEEQKKLAADLVLNGDKPAICITEPEAGSAATEMTTRADKRGDRYIINGKKHWITGGGVSRLHLIFARVFDEQGEEQESAVSWPCAARPKACASACASPPWACAASRKRRSSSRTWRCRRPWSCCRLRASSAASPT
ncbi:acyl-CoA dehydrogenase family protein [Fodinicurvata halophila]|uniref:acyl-CoA dehydrogenase family protein n=1 Tax=Fodinicurvata halophila TaxID=1419723 RepID=UPI00362F04F5